MVFQTDFLKGMSNFVLMYIYERVRSEANEGHDVQDLHMCMAFLFNFFSGVVFCFFSNNYHIM